MESWGHFKSGWNPTCLSAIKLVAASFDSIDDLQSTDNDSLSLSGVIIKSLSLFSSFGQLAAGGRNGRHATTNTQTQGADIRTSLETLWYYRQIVGSY